MKTRLRLALAAVCVLLSACSAGTRSVSTITNTHVPGLGVKGSASFDVVEIDQKAHLLYATDRSDSGVDVFDISGTSAKYVKTITTPVTPNGLALAPDLGKAFVGLSDGSVAIIDTGTDKVLQQAATGGKSVDLIEYSAERHEVYAANPDEGKIAVLNAVDGTKRTVISLGTATLEQPRYDPADHLLYVTSPDAGVIFQVDPSTGVTRNKLPLGTCHSNGMAIDPKHNQALVACRTWVLRINLHDPKDQHAFTQVAGGDVVVYDAKVDRFLVAAPGMVPKEVAVFGGNPIDYIGAVGGAGFGNSAALDESHGLVYTPDVRQGVAGVDGFRLPTGEISLADIPPAAVVVAGALILALIGAVVLIGRQGDPIKRPAPQPARRPSSKREQAPGEVRAGASRWTRKVEPPA